MTRGGSTERSPTASSSAAEQQALFGSRKGTGKELAGKDEVFAIDRRTSARGARLSADLLEANDRYRRLEAPIAALRERRVGPVGEG
jgi:hypothetical protein